jgi:hypothetical protein
VSERNIINEVFRSLEKRSYDCYCAPFWVNLRERAHWGDPGAYGKIILRWIFTKWDVGVWIGLIWLRMGTGGGHL